MPPPRHVLSKPFTALALVLMLASVMLASVMLASVARAEPAAVALAGAGTDAAAEQREPPARPWAEGVPEDAQKQALVLFEEGNKLFENSEHAAALAKYREALKVWDHPAIRYNAAVALINLDQPLAARENLELALRYGEAPFNPETHQQALTYRKLLRAQLAELKVVCVEPGADVALDGATLFVAPGEAARWLVPGAHQLVARKAGFQTETRSLSLLPGKPVVESLALREDRPVSARTERRWATWKPWAVLGGGALLAIAGVPVILDAKKNIDAFDADVALMCPAPKGCPTIPQAALDDRHRSHVDSVVAVSLFAVGGAMLASGAAMLIFNQPRVVPGEAPVHATITPVIGPGTYGLSLALTH
jgi:hypothetical protein